MTHSAAPPPHDNTHFQHNAFAYPRSLLRSPTTQYIRSNRHDWVAAVGGCDPKDPEDPGNLQYDWLEVQLQTFRRRGMQVSITVLLCDFLLSFIVGRSPSEMLMSILFGPILLLIGLDYRSCPTFGQELLP